ncbi:RNA polymerase sigma-70 factor [Flavobacterium polysaccharolyticum]|uniref:RNA polymerase sigma-70 factor n=1 Tax=Flavobacterium polysaccharolyticum TaxID=3133148 RepID=A0ABU9NLG7_9FLAO
MNSNSHFESKTFTAFKEGDQAAFSYFYSKYFLKIQSFSLQFLYDSNDAENLAQEAFVYLWEKREGIESIGGIPSFLYTFTKSKCLNMIRHKKVKDKFQSNFLNEKQRELDVEILNTIQLDTLELTELESIIQESISNLPPKTREIFIKKRFENKKNAEIAQEMGVSLKAVEAHVTKALRILKAKLSDYLFLIICFYL